MRLKHLGVVAAVLFSGLAQGQALYQEGLQYLRLLEPQPTDSGSKIEVIEFFSYACPHCREFEPYIEAWKKELPADVHLKLVPVVFNPGWKALAQGYYAAEALGVVDKIHEEMFKAIHEKREPYGTPEQVASIAAAAGVDKDRFLEAMNGFEVDRKISQSMQLLRGYRIQGVPTLAINGKFITGGSLADSYTQVIDIANYLIRQEMNAPKNDKAKDRKASAAQSPAKKQITTKDSK